MRLFSKITAGAALGFGLALSIALIAAYFDPDSTAIDRQGAILLLIFLGLPPIGLGSWLFWQGHQHYHRTIAKRVQAAFFRLLRQNQGRITPLQLAMATGLAGKAAQAYLDRQAREFDAFYNVTAEGTIFYQFSLNDAIDPSIH